MYRIFRHELLGFLGIQRFVAIVVIEDKIMLVKDFLTLYREDGFVQTIAEQIKAPKDFPHIQIKGFMGSLDAVIPSALHLLDEKQSHLLSFPTVKKRLTLSTICKI